MEKTKTLKTDGEMNIFLGQLRVPIYRCMAPVVIDFAGEMGRIVSYPKEDIHRLSLAAEEAFINTVDHFSGDTTTEKAVIECGIQGDFLVISIREKGIPFDLESVKKYDPKNIFEAEQPGLGLRLIEEGVDKVEVLVHGRAGKETRLLKRIDRNALPEEFLHSGTEPRLGVRKRTGEIVIREPEPDELVKVSRLAWRCWGYTQEAFLYEHAVLREKILSGEFVSFIAIDKDSGSIVGHSGLKYYPPGSSVPEAAAVFLNPEYRCPGLSKRLADILYENAESRGASGLFDSAVTTHVFSQKMGYKRGARPCGIMLGIAPAGLKAKRLANTEQPKGSVINNYVAFDRSECTVYVPELYQPMIKQMYGWMDLPRNLAEPGIAPLPDSSNVDMIRLPDELNVAFIIVHTIGIKTADQILGHVRQCRMDRLDAVYLFLPLASPGLPVLAPACNKAGFFFAGIMPHIHDGEDRLILQSVNVPIDTDQIRLFADEAKELLKYILTDRDRHEQR